MQCFVIALVCMGLASCFAKPGSSKRNERGMSPGPPGGLIDRDYRVPVMWINEPGQYGPGDYGRWLRFGDRDRFYLVHVPPQYKPGEPTPLVLVLHGGGGNPDVARYGTRMDETADRHGFIVVYPAATSPLFTDRMLFWNAGATPKNRRQRNVDDVGFISEVLDDVAQFFSVDPQRTYATGISNGAHMCYLLAARLGNRLAAIGPVAGQRAVGQYAPVPAGPIPLIHFHGARDTWLPIAGGHSNPDRSGFEQFDIAPLTEAIGSWVAHNGCAAEPQESHVGNARRLEYSSCTDGADVVLWVLEDGGHTWPSGRTTKTEERGQVGHINTDVSASEEIWKFFSEHPQR